MGASSRSPTRLVANSASNQFVCPCRWVRSAQFETCGVAIAILGPDMGLDDLDRLEIRTRRPVEVVASPVEGC